MVVFLYVPTIAQGEIRGNLEIRGEYFPDGPKFPKQSTKRWQPIVAGEFQWQDEFFDAMSSKVSVFGKYHPFADRELTGDIREGWIGYLGASSELKAGMLNERWGRLEAESIVDILNPRDAFEDFQGDVNLGVPGVSFSYLSDQVQYSFWVLPYSRARRLARGKDRFRLTELPLRDENFSHGRAYPSAAGRITTFLGDVEVGLSHFYGHVRFPSFEVVLDAVGRPLGLRPQYDIINQSSVDVLWVQGHTLWKLESFYQVGPEDHFFAVAAGVEREFPSIAGSKKSLTLFAEGYYDDRSTSFSVPFTPFQRDVFVGARVSLNDFASTEFQIRFTHDWKHESTLVDVRAQRRLDRVWGVEGSVNLFVNAQQDPALGGFREDHRFQIKLIRSF
ncbi:MAG: hypothetical protein NPIRA02_18460 [Nitrospirales bacterium]|nr:MAG: hypothetical protein NPIRA02_18460 [Nitrospirales bacterium]